MPPREKRLPPADTSSASPPASANALLYLAIQKPMACARLPALVSWAVPVISLDEVDTTIVSTWNPPTSLWPLE